MISGLCTKFTVVYINRSLFYIASNCWQVHTAFWLARKFMWGGDGEPEVYCHCICSPDTYICPIFTLSCRQKADLRIFIFSVLLLFCILLRIPLPTRYLFLFVSSKFAVSCVIEGRGLERRAFLLKLKTLNKLHQMHSAVCMHLSAPITHCLFLCCLL